MVTVIESSNRTVHQIYAMCLRRLSRHHVFASPFACKLVTVITIHTSRFCIQKSQNTGYNIVFSTHMYIYQYTKNVQKRYNTTTRNQTQIGSVH